MSVLLTAGRKSVQKPKSAKPKKKPRVVKRVQIPASTPGFKIWQYMIEGTLIEIWFKRETMEVWCNTEKIDTVDDFSEEGAVMDFWIFEHMFRIKRERVEGQLEHILLIDGYAIEEYGHQPSEQTNGASCSEEYAQEDGEELLQVKKNV